MTKDILYDPECERLASYFLGERATPERLRLLSGVIQSAIEDWLEDDEDVVEGNEAEALP